MYVLQVQYDHCRVGKHTAAKHKAYNGEQTHGNPLSHGFLGALLGALLYSTAGIYHV